MGKLFAGIDIGGTTAKIGLVDENGNITAEFNGNTYGVNIEGTILSAKLPNDEKITCSVYLINSLSFNIEKNESQTLYVCKAYFSLTDNKVDYLTFTINPYVGDVV